MKRPRLNPRKLLIASAGVATVNYAFAAGCSDGKKSQEWVVANLMPAPPPCCTAADAGGAILHTVANLVAPPPPVSRPAVPPPPVLLEPRDAAAQDAEPGDAAQDADSG